MGYTIVTSFDDSFYKKMDEVLCGTNANKIPFGRDCDRDAANQILKYHMTLVHWKKKYDNIYLPRTNKIKFIPFSLSVVGTEIMNAEEGGFLLYFVVKPEKGYKTATSSICDAMELNVSQFMHITIAVSKDEEYVTHIKKIVDRNFSYPFELSVDGIDVYHVWRPVKLVNHISAMK